MAQALRRAVWWCAAGWRDMESSAVGSHEVPPAKQRESEAREQGNGRPARRLSAGEYATIRPRRVVVPGPEMVPGTRAVD